MIADTRVFTFYCDVHFWEVKQGPPPGCRSRGNALSPVCPTCFRYMFWVPNGGTVVPREAS